jgi:ribosomal-protein-alanine N-acetyltransferase
MSEILYTARLRLEPVSLAFVEAILCDDRVRAEAEARAALPPAWPNRDLVERAFSSSLDQIRSDPERRLWGDRLLLLREGERVVVGSVVFHGRPDEGGVAEIGYGIDERHAGRGLATEATLACVEWALAQPGVCAVAATTFPVHLPSIRVLEKIGMRRVGVREHELFGELLVFERRG